MHIQTDSSSDALELYLTYEPRLRWSANFSTLVGVGRLKLFNELQYAAGTNHHTTELCTWWANPWVWPSWGSTLGVFQRQVRVTLVSFSHVCDHLLPCPRLYTRFVFMRKVNLHQKQVKLCDFLKKKKDFLYSASLCDSLRLKFC